MLAVAEVATIQLGQWHPPPAGTGRREKTPLASLVVVNHGHEKLGIAGGILDKEHRNPHGMLDSTLDPAPVFPRLPSVARFGGFSFFGLFPVFAVSVCHGSVFPFFVSFFVSFSLDPSDGRDPSGTTRNRSRVGTIDPSGVEVNRNRAARDRARFVAADEAEPVVSTAAQKDHVDCHVLFLRSFRGSSQSRAAFSGRKGRRRFSFPRLPFPQAWSKGHRRALGGLRAGSPYPRKQRS